MGDNEHGDLESKVNHQYVLFERRGLGEVVIMYLLHLR